MRRCPILNRNKILDYVHNFLEAVDEAAKSLYWAHDVCLIERVYYDVALNYYNHVP